MKSTPKLEAERRVFDGAAQRHVEQLNEAWAKLLDAPSELIAAELHRELHTLKTESSLLGLTDLHLLCAKLEDLVFLAHRRHYDVPAEMFLTVSMAMEFLGFLVSKGAAHTDTEGADGDPSVDLVGFIGQLDAVLNDTRALPMKDDSSGNSSGSSSSKRKPPQAVSGRSSNAEQRPSRSGEFPTFELTTDRVSRPTRERIANIATGIYLESMRVEGSSGLRLRESWGQLRRELTDVGRVSLRESLLRHVEGLPELALSFHKVVSVSSQVEDASVSPEVAAVLDTAALQLLNNAIAHGIETPEARALANKPRDGKLRMEARAIGGAVILTIEDDGAGIDVAAAAAAAAPNNNNNSSLGLDAVREAVGKQRGTIAVRTVEGRGTAMTVTVPDTATNMMVRTFRPPNGHLLLAVDDSWHVTEVVREDDNKQGEGGAIPLDPIGVLGLRSKDDGAVAGGAAVQPHQHHVHTVLFRRDSHAFEIAVRAFPMVSAASRICPTSPSSAAEVILVGAAEAILLRLDHLAKSGSQSTIPPPAAAAATRTTLASPSFAVVVAGDGANDHDRDRIAPSRKRGPPPAVTIAARPLAREAHKVLLVDGDATWLVLTRSALLHRGFDVRAVGAIAEFLEALEQWSPDLILADAVNLAEISDEELCRRVKSVRPLIPVILFSDMEARAIERLATSANADGALPKSLGPNELARAIRQHCGKSSAL